MSSIGFCATEQEAYDIGGKGTPISNKMATENRAKELGCKITGLETVDGNKLVVKTDLAKAITSLGPVTIKSGRLTINKTGGSWDYDFSWTVPLPEKMNFTVTYTNALTGESYSKVTNTISQGSTSAQGRRTDKFSFVEGTFVGTASNVNPSDENYEFG